jgi:ketosteroid isomerase-like protein
VLVTLILLLPIGCATAVESPTQEEDLEAERASLLDTDRALSEAYATSDTPLDTVFASFSDDARVLAPEAPIALGWEASRAVFANLEALPGYSLTWSPTTAEVGSGADLGYTIGTYHMQLPDGDGNVAEIDGKYLSIWKRQSDGRWKITVDMFNSNGPPVPVAE